MYNSGFYDPGICVYYTYLNSHLKTVYIYNLGYHDYVIDWVLCILPTWCGVSHSIHFILCVVCKLDFPISIVREDRVHCIYKHFISMIVLI